MKYLIVLAVFAFFGCLLTYGSVIRDEDSSLIDDDQEEHLLTRRDLTKDLNVTVTALLKKADEAIKKLEKQNQTAEIEYIKKEEALILNLLKQIQTEKNATKLIVIDHEFTTAYSNLSYELHKLELAAVDQKAVLVEKATALEKQAETLVKKLKAEKLDSDATILEREEERIKQLVLELKNVKTPTGLSVIEHELKTAEERLTASIKKVVFHEFDEKKEKERLLQRAERLEKQAEIAIKKLKEVKKDSDAAVLEKEEAVVKALVVKLNATVTEAEIHKIENELQTAEDKLFFELKKYASLIDPPDSAHKQQIIQKASTLEKQAEEAIKKLKAAKKDKEVAIIEKDEALLKRLVTELQAAKTEADVKKIEHELTLLENRLAAEIKKANA